MTIPRLQGTTSGARPIVQPRDNSAAQAISSVGSMFDSMAKTGHTGFDQSTMEALSDYSATTNIVRQGLAAGTLTAAEAEMRLSRELTKFFDDPRIGGDNRAMTMARGLKQSTMTGAVFEAQNMVDKERAKKYSEYGLDPRNEEHQVKMSEMSQRDAEVKLAEAELELYKRNKTVGKERIKLTNDRLLRARSSELVDLLEGELGLSPSLQIVGLQSEDGVLRFPPRETFSELSDEEKGKWYGKVEFYLDDIQADLLDTGAYATEKEVEEAMAGMRLRVDAHKSFMNKESTVEQYNLKKAHNDALFGVEQSAIPVQRAEHYLKVLGSLDPLTASEMLSLDNKKMFEWAVRTVVGNGAKIDLTQIKDPKDKGTVVQTILPVVTAHLNRGDYGKMSDADFKIINDIITLDILPSVDPKNSGGDVPPQAYDSFMASLDSGNAITNLLSDKTPTATRSAVIDLAVSYGSNAARQALGDLPQGYTLDPDTYRIEIQGNGIDSDASFGSIIASGTEVSQVNQWNNKYSERLRTSMNVLSKIEGNTPEDMLGIYGLIPQEAPQSGSDKTSQAKIVIPKDIPDNIRQLVADNFDAFESQEQLEDFVDVYRPKTDGASE